MYQIPNVQLAERTIALCCIAFNGNANGIGQSLRLLLVPVRELPLLSRVCLDDRSGQRVPILQSIRYDTVGGSNTFGRSCLQSVFYEMRLNDVQHEIYVCGVPAVHCCV